MIKSMYLRNCFTYNFNIEICEPPNKPILIYIRYKHQRTYDYYLCNNNIYRSISNCFYKVLL